MGIFNWLKDKGTENAIKTGKLTQEEVDAARAQTSAPNETNIQAENLNFEIPKDIQNLWNEVINNQGLVSAEDALLFTKLLSEKPETIAYLNAITFPEMTEDTALFIQDVENNLVTTIRKHGEETGTDYKENLATFGVAPDNAQDNLTTTIEQMKQTTLKENLHPYYKATQDALSIYFENTDLTSALETSKNLSDPATQKHLQTIADGMSNTLGITPVTIQFIDDPDAKSNAMTGVDENGAPIIQLDVNSDTFNNGTMANVIGVLTQETIHARDLVVIKDYNDGKLTQDPVMQQVGAMLDVAHRKYIQPNQNNDAYANQAGEWGATEIGKKFQLYTQENYADALLPLENKTSANKQVGQEDGMDFFALLQLVFAMPDQATAESSAENFAKMAANGEINLGEQFGMMGSLISMIGPEMVGNIVGMVYGLAEKFGLTNKREQIAENSADIIQNQTAMIETPNQSVNLNNTVAQVNR